MNQFQQTWRAFHADQSGQDMIEYALVAALLALGAITSMKALSTSMTYFWNQFFAKVASIWP
jgi:Flp pilus assembly pilin Flp